MNLSNFERQHKDIYMVMDSIKDLINASNFDEADLAKLINKLAGQLNIHLSLEDKFLYPALLKDEKTADMAKRYVDEMGGIFEEFTEYKNKYNTRSKIMDFSATVIADSKQILDKIYTRMNKEENDIYKLIDQQNTWIKDNLVTGLVGIKQDL